MHGLRCDPALLGWTRLLDEWVVGLTRREGETAQRLVCWDDPAQAANTVAEAASRVRSFAFRETDVEPTRLSETSVMRVELQGRAYCVALDQHWPASVEAATDSASNWLKAAQRRAGEAAAEGELAVGAVLLTPQLESGPDSKGRAQLVDGLIALSRAVRCSGCAFSFPHAGEELRYRHGAGRQPGALLLVEPLA